MSMGSWGLRESRQQRRRQRRKRVFVALAIVLLAVVSAVYAYQVGTLRAQKPLAELEQALALLKTEQVFLARENEELRSRVEAAGPALALKARLDRGLPGEQAEALVKAVGERLDAGVPAERLAFAIAAIGPGGPCDGQKVTKRLMVHTPHTAGGSPSVVFGEAVTVTAGGASILGPAGKPEPRYDPAQPVSLAFEGAAGEIARTGGVLPLDLALVAAGDEFRFTATPGAPGFVEITGRRCAFP
ncbi:MAG: hypothetical protein QNJ67_18650 [Kiloniellales bacterium]|nr:hypothetical protein [Kiloniellales bacterium]